MKAVAVVGCSGAITIAVLTGISTTILTPSARAQTCGDAECLVLDIGPLSAGPEPAEASSTPSGAPRSSAFGKRSSSSDGVVPSSSPLFDPPTQSSSLSGLTGASAPSSPSGLTGLSNPSSGLSGLTGPSAKPSALSSGASGATSGGAASGGAAAAGGAIAGGVVVAKEASVTGPRISAAVGHQAAQHVEASEQAAPSSTPMPPQVADAVPAGSNGTRSGR